MKFFLQNIILKGFSALAALDQSELLMKNQKQLGVIVAETESVINSVLEMAPQQRVSKN